MARSMLWIAFCGSIFAAGVSWGQNTPASWPTTNPVRQENQPNATNQPAYRQNNPPQRNPYPAATQPNNPPNRYPDQPGVPNDNRYPAVNQPVNPPVNQPVTPEGRYSLRTQPGQPDQPVNPQPPTLQRHPALEQAQPIAPPPEYQLTPAEQAQVDVVLNLWEQKSKDIKTFDCKFYRWEYDLTLPVLDPKAPPGSDPLPNFKDQGILKYAMPDKGLYRITYTDKFLNDKWEPTTPDRIQHWICDGSSVFEYQYPTDPNDPKKPGTVIEHPLAPEMKGKAIADGPLPFLFGAEAKKLRDRYYFKILPANDPQKEVVLDACPKWQQDRQNFSRAVMILNWPEMTPKALQLTMPGGKNKTSYEFIEIVVNDKLTIFKGNPFQAYTPRGWQKVTEQLPTQNTQVPPPAQVGRPQGPATR